ncbi:hypothetical protein BDP27DRAFT_1258970 [Rhodocollybia butyracea]|uniref:Zinc finger Mcm10/DnaG-type domain-containing protein n=1 Tax=Rhodocollybia butyracea TaxID=206335 RepID=A0A9P5UCR5_9AGAR|nr:hypothetical protein BDP27DRAFT_1258970 [Rhodocollybia butyracea]
MDSRHKAQKEKEKKEAIRKQIALLQSQLSGDDESDSVPTSPKAKAGGHELLVPCTPSPRKKRKLEDPTQLPSRAAPLSNLAKFAPEQTEFVPQKVAPSKLVQKLSKLHSVEEDGSRINVQRTSSFTDKPAEIIPGVSKRDENLAIIESLELGPAEHKSPFDDPHFERVEPNSGTRLKSRILPHDDLQDHLRGRYYLTPSRLYSCINLLPDKTGYDVPVDGDWITIAVVAERGPIKYTNPPVGIVREEETEEDGAPSAQKKDKGKETKKTKHNPEAPNPRRRYVNVKLIDFGSRTSSSSVTKGQIRGDAFLMLLLFEAEACDLITEEYGEKLAKPKKVYRGGSGGAFEVMAKLKEGDVIALLNPRIMKPFTNASSSSPHPVHNILAVTPTNANSITHIGRSLDLGRCNVQKRDGSVCGSWCDKRISDVCEWHISNAVQRRRAARPEFAIGTSGMTNSAVVKGKFDSHSKYDPVRKTGLLPRGGIEPLKKFGSNSYDRETGATYVLSGHVINNSNSVDSTHISEQMGREGQARAQRAEAKRREEELLKKMMKNEMKQDSGSGHVKSVLKARAALKQARNETESELKTKKESLPKAKEKERESLKRRSQSKDLGDDDEEDEEEGDEMNLEKLTPVSRYRPEMIKTLGFDPVAMKLGPQRQSNADIQKKLADLATLQKSRKQVDLGPRPGRPKIRSGVFKPAIEPARFKDAPVSLAEAAEYSLMNAASADFGEMMVDLDSSDAE